MSSWKPYPKKCISWEKITHAVNQGMADEDPEVLSKFVGDYVFNPVAGGNEIQSVSYTHLTLPTNREV